MDGKSHHNTLPQDQEVLVWELEPWCINLHSITPFFIVHCQGAQLGYFQSLTGKHGSILFFCTILIALQALGFPKWFPKKNGLGYITGEIAL